MQIKLGSSFMFFLPNGTCHLSEENPGPIEIDFDTLSVENQKIIYTAIHNHQIIKLSSEKPSKEKRQDLEVREPTAVTKDLFEKDNILLGQLQTLLNKRVPDIKVEIAKVEDSRILNFLSSLEQQGKNRKTIIELINNKITDIQKHVLASITEIDTNIKTDQLDKLSRSFIDEIEDGPVEKIEIEIQ